VPDVSPGKEQSYQVGKPDFSVSGNAWLVRPDFSVFQLGALKLKIFS
jgi:hypothetical protein